MLVDLRIRNYALIEQLQLQPSALLNIITGETGAGKSIMLGAIGLLLGNRADSRMLFDTEKKCVIEGQFDISSYQLQDIFESEDLDYDTQCILRREISPGGKSRAFVNDTPVTLETLRHIGANLMAMSWCFLAICCIIRPTFTAISPLIPVSISSNTIVGNAVLSASIYLMHNISRENSPPEAALLRV